MGEGRGKIFYCWIIGRRLGEDWMGEDFLLLDNWKRVGWMEEGCNGGGLEEGWIGEGWMGDDFYSWIIGRGLVGWTRVGGRLGHVPNFSLAALTLVLPFH